MLTLSLIHKINSQPQSPCKLRRPRLLQSQFNCAPNVLSPPSRNRGIRHHIVGVEDLSCSIQVLAQFVIRELISFRHHNQVSLLVMLKPLMIAYCRNER